MKCTIPKSLRFFSALGMMCLSSVAMAESVTFSAATPTVDFGPFPYGPYFDETVTLPRFNPAFGTLNSIALELDAVGTTSGWGLDVFNPFLFAVDANGVVSGNLRLLRPDSSELVFAGHFSAAISFGLLPPSSTTSLFAPVPDSTASVLLTNPGDLWLFTGADTVALPVDGRSYPSVSPNTLRIVSATPQIGFGRVTVTYDFTPIPEPSSLALLTLAIPSLALFQRRIGELCGSTCTGND